MKSKLCKCDTPKEDHEIINNWCDMCNRMISLEKSYYKPMENRFVDRKVERPEITSTGIKVFKETIKVLQQKWEDDQGNFKWLDVPTIEEK